MLKIDSTLPNFVTIEKKILKYWQDKKILEKYLLKNKTSQKHFSFLDGPITANNPMGVHHAWGRTYKDFWQRFYNLQNANQRFQNGFDEQGLWIEVEVEKELGLKNKKDIENLISGDPFASIAKFVNLCKDRVKKFSKIQTQQSIRLGYFMDWENSYHTSSDQNNYAIWHYLKEVCKKGWLYKGHDTVPWCPRCGTAISQHEILTEEYQEITHKAIYVKYKLKDSDEQLLVWTTTPWTLLSNVAIAANPDFVYKVFKNSITGEKVVVISDDEIEDFGKEDIFNHTINNIGDWFEVKEYSGFELTGKVYIGIFDDLPALKDVKHHIVAAKDLVTAEEGTGFVHIAPGAGEEDFNLAQKEGLSVIASIDESADYIEGFGKFSGKNAKDNPEIIIDELKNRQALFKVEDYTHRYPVCWRCKTELVWRIVDEWYIAMDKEDPKIGKTYRQMMKDVIKNINWIPKWGYDRELDWLSNMHDWLISKKRYWGLALPIWECKNCGQFEVIGSKEELKSKAINGWENFSDKSPHRPWIDQVKIKCTKCESIVSRIQDVGNPWLDAGIVPFSTLNYFSNRKYWSKWFPADFITESFPGQFKNWFYALIAMSTALEYKAPFKTLLGHGQVRDEKGEEMHKSKGNAIEFNEAADTIGVDVMRWLYLRTNPEHNVNFGDHIADEIRRHFHIRLWNIYSFFVNYALLDNWKPKAKKFKPKHVLDRWILSRLAGNIKNVTQALDGQNNHKYQAYDAIGHAEIFIINDLSNWYIRRIKNRIGPNTKSSKDKDDTYQTLYFILTKYLRVLAPMIPFITEEMYINITGEESIHLTTWPKHDRDHYDRGLEEEMQTAIDLASIIHALRKEKGIKVRQPLSKLEYKRQKPLPKEIEQILAEEINVKKIIYNPKLKTDFVLDTKIDKALAKEGIARDLIREIQQKRKESKLNQKDKIIISLPDWPQEFSQFIKEQTIAVDLKKGKEFKIEKI